MASTTAWTSCRAVSSVLTVEQFLRTHVELQLPVGDFMFPAPGIILRHLQGGVLSRVQQAGPTAELPWAGHSDRRLHRGFRAGTSGRSACACPARWFHRREPPPRRAIRQAFQDVRFDVLADARQPLDPAASPGLERGKQPGRRAETPSDNNQRLIRHLRPQPSSQTHFATTGGRHHHRQRIMHAEFHQRDDLQLRKRRVQPAAGHLLQGLQQRGRIAHAALRAIKAD